MISQELYERFYWLLDDDYHDYHDERDSYCEVRFHRTFAFCEVEIEHGRRRWIGREWILCLGSRAGSQLEPYRLIGSWEAFYADITEAVLRT